MGENYDVLTALINGAFRAKRFTNIPGEEVSKSNHPTGCLKIFSKTNNLTLAMTFSFAVVAPFACNIEYFEFNVEYIPT